MSADYMSLRIGAASQWRTVEVKTDELIAIIDEVEKLRAAVPAKKTRAKKATAVGAAVVTLPDWMPMEAWAAFLDMRKQIKKPATDYAQKLLLKKLAAFHANDMDVGVIINQSIMSGWQDLYAPRDGQAGRHAPQMSVQEQNRRNAEEARRMLGFSDLDAQGSIL